jgi:dihydroflavonol-4-reductase
MKKALVTGAAGFIGSHVVQELLQDNVEVKALIMPGEDTKNLEGMDIETMEGNILDQDAVKAAVKGVDTIFHLAAIYAIWMKDWRNIYEVNIQGSRNVLWTALKAGVNRVVYTSSVAALGVKAGKTLSDEETLFNQYDLGNHYVLTKYLSQQEALGFARNGLDLVVVNPCFPFGENDIAPTPTGQIIIDTLSGLNRFAFGGGFNVVDVKDVARGHLLAAKKGKAGEKYILGNQNLTLEKFMRLVYKTAGFEKRMLIKIPGFLMKTGTIPLKYWADHVSHKPPLSSPPEIEYASQYLFFDNTKARENLGLKFTPVKDSLKRSINWFRKNGYA